jgi:hypothetical protein
MVPKPLSLKSPTTRPSTPISSPGGIVISPQLNNSGGKKKKNKIETLRATINAQEKLKQEQKKASAQQPFDLSSLFSPIVSPPTKKK